MTVPTFAASLFLWLISAIACSPGGRTRERSFDLEPASRFAIAVSVLTFIGEAVGLAIALLHVSPLLVLGTMFDFDAGIRPGWQVLAAGLAVVVIDSNT